MRAADPFPSPSPFLRSQFELAIGVRRYRDRIRGGENQFFWSHFPFLRSCWSNATMVSTVKVHNVSLNASERDIKEFFCFSGDIIHVEMQSGDERSQFAYITFKDGQESERAMLLTGATIVDMAVIITPATNYQLPAAVIADLESQNPTGIESALRKAEDVVGSMLAKGFVLGKDALEKAKAFDETHQFTSTATAKVSSLDRSLGLSQKFSTGTLVVNEKMKEMDQKYQVAEKTKSALVAAEQTVSTAGSAIMSHRYVLTGAAWVTDAYNKVATTASDTATKTEERMMADQDGKNPDDELTKSHLHESSGEAGQECKHQKDECPKTNISENPETGKLELKKQEGKITTAQVQENAETGEKEHKHQEGKLPEANTPESLLMAEQNEQERKNLDRGSPVTIPVCMATTDENSSNSPKKVEPAQGFI